MENVRIPGSNLLGNPGEGFKIASLCAIRDCGWHIELRSREWILTVVTTDLSVEGKTLKSLGYRICTQKRVEPDTTLRISSFYDQELLENVLLSFYSPQNPLLGSKIWESEDTAVYFRSQMPKPRGYPRTYSHDGPGIVFAGYQALGSFPAPLVFCAHRYRFNDRDRSNFFTMDVVKVIHSTVTTLSPEASAILLRALKRRWYDRPRRKYDFETWSGIIRVLVNNVAKSPTEAEKFNSDYPNLVVAPSVKKSRLTQYNRRRQALDWLRNSELSSRLVQEAFFVLGYTSLEDACERAGGFSVIRDPEGSELKRIALLEQLVHTVFVELFRLIEIPPCKIIKSEVAAWQGMTTCIPLKEKITFNGMRIRFRLPYIALKASLLHPNTFGEALSTYIHEIAHMFGSDQSAAFSRALSEFMQILCNNSQNIANYQSYWEKGDDPSCD